MTERRAKRAERVADSQQTFADVAAAWLAKQKGEWAPIHFTKSKRALERDVMPTLGKLPVSRGLAPVFPDTAFRPGCDWRTD